MIQAYHRIAAQPIVDDTLAAIDDGGESPPGLTPRESEVLDLVAGGLSNAQIALELCVSQRTVAKHLEHTYAKLGVASRTAAVARAHELV